MLRLPFNYLRNQLLNVPIGAALLVILLLGLLPAIVMGLAFLSRGTDDLAVVENELVGLEVLRELQTVDSFVVLPPKNAEVRKSEASKQWASLRRTMRHNSHGEALGILDESKLVLDQLRVMMYGLDGRPARPMEKLIKGVGDNSGLILDPQLDSYYLMDIVLIKSRKLKISAYELLNAHGDKNAEKNHDLIILAKHRLSDATTELKSAALAAIAGNDDGTLSRSDLMKSVNATITASNKFTAANDQAVPTQFQTLIKNNQLVWKSSSTQLKKALINRKTKISSELWFAAGVCAAVVLIVLLMAGTLINLLSGGLKNISHRLTDLSYGDFNSAVPGTEFNNDIGVIASALQDFINLSGQVEADRAKARQELEDIVAKVKAENEQLFASKLDQEAKSHELERNAIAMLASELEAKLSGLLSGSQSAAKQMGTEAAAMATSTDGIQREAANAAKAANDIRSLVQGLAPVVQTVAHQLEGYTGSLSDARNLAADAVQRVDTANRRIGDFNIATSRVGEMLNLISKVAHKTNMLALNASIEAARVGEAGHGFIVVADEVKALARSTRDAAIDISRQIGEMEGANAAVAGAFGDIIEVVNTLASQSEAVALGMNDQTAAIATVEDGITMAADELSNMVNSIDTADTAATAAQKRSAEMMAASRHVTQNVGALDQSVRTFLGGLENAQASVANVAA